MNFSEAQLQSFTTAELNTYNLSSLTIDREVAKSAIQQELLEEVTDLNLESTQQSRLDFFKVEGATKDHYSEKVLSISADKELIYGIRNMGGNPEVPFIQLIPNFKISSKEECLEIYKLIKEEFKVFRPLHLSFHSAHKVNADFYGSIYMVSKTQELITQNHWPVEEFISFESIEDDSYYGWYRDGYEEFHRDFPELKSKVDINSLHSMQDPLEQGLIKYVILDEERIGIIVGEASNFLGHTAVYFHEIYITKKYKGKGLAKAIQRKYVMDFCSESDFVWGTIDSMNIPSYKTAYSNGRRPIRYESFINLA